jgi:hypothetical protein
MMMMEMTMIKTKYQILMTKIVNYLIGRLSMMIVGVKMEGETWNGIT